MATRGRHMLTAGRRGLALAMVGVLIVGACSSDIATPASTTTPGTSSTTGDGSVPGPDDSGNSGNSGNSGAGMATLRNVSNLRLSEGTADAAVATPVAVLSGEPIDQTVIDGILARLPEWAVDDSLSLPFSWPTESLRPPITGDTIDVAFPDPAQTGPPAPTEVTSGPLHVLRSQPEGDVAVAPFASITFDQPMVPIATVEQLAGADVPATITPDIPGRWQWIGTRTLRFDATSDLVDRLPMATEFTITVPAGTTSASGGQLAEAVGFTFSTPPVTVQSLEPTGESLPLVPVFVAAFDQRVDASAVLSTIVVTADGQLREVRLATAEEIDADDAARRTAATAPADRWIAFRPVEPFAPDTAISVAVGPGVPSAEGPIVTTDATTYDGRTYAPLRVEETRCGQGDKCPPSSSIDISFNNSLDLDAFDPSTITVSPDLGGLRVEPYGNGLTVFGDTLGRSTYRVTLPAGLTDVFGQTLGKDTTVEVTIGSASPLLQPFAQLLTTLDPLADGTSLPIVSVNHEQLRVRIFGVDPADWPAFQSYAIDTLQYGDTQASLLDWPLITDTTIDTGGQQDRRTETTLDLAAAFGGGTGSAVVLVESTEQYSQDDNDYWANRPTATWVQATSLGVDVVADTDQLRAWVTDLATGAPVQDVTITQFGVEGSDITNEDGLATLQLSDVGTTGVLAAAGDDVAILPAGDYGTGLAGSDRPDEARWYVIDDRGIYRPGETVSVKGLVRRLTTATDAQIQLLGDGVTVAWTAIDAQGNQIGDGTSEVSPLGGFDLAVDLPASVNLGYAYIQFDVSGVSGLPSGYASHGFQIEEFRRPEFEVAARAESAGPYVLDAPLTLAVDATYYAGGPLAAAPVDWSVTTSPATYSPPGWDEFTFGEWTPWWYDTESYAPEGGGSTGIFPDESCCFPSSGSEVATYQGTSDADGTHFLQVELNGLKDSLNDLPVTVTAQASVEDVNRQQWASSTSVLVHPADFYVGLRTTRTFVREGEPLDIDAIVTDIDGNIVAGRPVQITAGRLEYGYVDGAWTEQLVDVQTCDVTSSADAEDPVSCSFTTNTGGTYTISTTITDDRAHTSRTELTRWVSGGDAVPTRNVERQDLTLVPDLETYEPGQTAELLVQSPFATGTGLLTVGRNGIVSTSTFVVEQAAAVLEIPVGDADIPNLDISIEVVGATERTADDGTALADAPLRPAFATGQLTLNVSAASRRLEVAATPRSATLAPGDDTQIDVAVTDPAGNPVAGAELAVVVVDEAVLALSQYQLTDPLGAFYSQLPSYISTLYGRDSIVLANPVDLVTGLPETGGDGATADTEAPAGTAAASDSAGAAPGDNAVPAPLADAGEDKDAASVAAGTPTGTIDVRTNFDALAVFEPEVMTDAAGNAVIDVPLPDNLTRYRVMVVAVSGVDRFGSAESNITARLPLMVRPSAPRFANFGDVFDLPVVLQNQTDVAMEADVVLQTTNLDVTGPAGVHVTVPANDRIEVRFPVSVSQAGTARFRVAAVSGDAQDAATVEFPVYTPATAEAFATYGVIDDGSIAQPVLAPTDVIAQFGGLEITTSSTSLQALTDAVLFLTQYDFGSTDALASRILAISSLRDVLDAFDADGMPSPAELKVIMASDIESLIALQNGDGGFPFWELSRPSEPFNSVQAAHSLIVAEADGENVPQSAIDASLGYLGDIESHIPADWGQESRDTVMAYALNVRNLAGDRDSAAAEALFAQRGEELPLEAIAWLWPVVDDDATSAAIERIIGNRAVDTAGAVTFTTDVTDNTWVTLTSDRRTDGLVLDALIAVRPDSDMIPKVVSGLLGHRTAGRWDSVQENSFILLALHRYFETYESQTPDFVARVWLGDRFAGEQTFSGRSTDRLRINLPTADLIATGDADLVLAKEGAGRLYYRIGLRTAPADLRLDPLDRGFVVQRSYEAVDDPAEVSRDADGTWRVRAGARVRVRLTMVAESQRTHVALIDPLPAGFEILNSTLATTPDVPTDPGADSAGSGAPESSDGFDVPAISRPFEDWSWWWGTWFDHQNLRDDRAEAFAGYLPAGTYDYSYVVRATTPGTFVAPPTRAEELYAPETFGRGATDTVVVEA